MSWKKRHPGGGGETNYAGKQKRIDPAEKIRRANKPRKIQPADAKRHPGA